MLFDLGLDHKQLDNEALVEKKIEEVEKRFQMVMIAEYFSESLVMMKKELCWEWDDVTSFHLNGRKKNDKHPLDETTRSLLKEYLKSDYKLYNHFLDIFERKMDTYGRLDLHEDVKKLEQKNKELYVSCSIEESRNGKLKGDQKWYGPSKLIGYKVHNPSDERCLLMTMSGLKLIDRVRDRQIEKLLSL